MSRIATNITIFDQAVVSGTNFTTGLILARILGIDAYGLFILLTGVILFASNIQNAVIISPMMVTGPARSHDDAHYYYQTTAVLQAIVSTVFFMLIIAIGTLLNITLLETSIDYLVLPLALAASGLMLQEYFRRYFFATKKIIHALINDCLSYGLQLITIVTVYFLHGVNLQICLYIIAITSYVAVAHGIISTGLLIRLPKIKVSDYRETAVEHWLFGKWLIARNVSYWLGTQMIIYTAGILLSVAAVGAIGAARNIVGIVNILFLALDNFAVPRASRCYAISGIDGLSKYTKRISILGGIATAGIALLASIDPEFWLHLAYSDEYTGYGWIVIAWAIYFLIGFFQRPIGMALRVLNSTRSIFNGATAGMIVAIAISYPAISHGGLTGALGTLIAVQLVITLYYIHAYRQKMRKS